MTTSIWPETHGTLILDLRYRRNDDGNFVPALVAVDKDGKERTLGKVVEVRDGGGHVELHRGLIAEDIGFDRNGAGEVNLHPENM